MMGKGYKKIAHILKHRLLSLALIALLIQATLPYLLTNCPVYLGAQTASASHSTMPADCPMLAMHQARTQTADSAKHPAKPSSDLTCPLCAVMSPLHSFIVAGLVALPPPPVVVTNSFLVLQPYQTRLPATASFSARAPPELG